MSRMVIIPSLGDNFVYLYDCGHGQAVAVDPGETAGVMRALDENGLALAIVLCSHHHWDHTGGVAELKRAAGCSVVGGDSRRIKGIDKVVHDNDVVKVGDVEIEVISTPGHTRTSVCYYVREGAGDKGILWTGDTMFAGGCGRILECGARTMYESLQKLASLGDDTLVYPGHDYTLENCEFASGIEPENLAVAERVRDIRQRVQARQLTIPSAIAQERLTNPFLRADEAELAAALDMAGSGAVEVFAELRRRKDVF